MTGSTKLMTAGGGGVNIQPASSIASDVTVKVPVTGVSGGTLICSDSSGNVGIGTSSPSAKVHISAPDGTAPLTLNTAGGSDSTRALNFNVAGDNYGKILVPSGSGGAMAFWTGGANASTERMRIDSSGNLLVGTTTNSNSTKAVIGWSSATQFGLTLDDTYTGSAGATAVYFRRNGSNIGSISTTTTATAYNTSSDYRLKENIQPMQNALATVAQLNPVTYTWKADGSDGQGFIAHELKAVVPDCVTGEKDAVDAEGNPVYQGIDTSFLVATLTKAVQELNEKVEAQAAEIAALKGAAQ